MGFLGHSLASESHFLLFGILFDENQPVCNLLLGQCQLGCRIDHDLIQLRDGSLALRIKRADGIHLVVPELNAHRSLLRQGKNVNNPAAHGELPHTVHLPHRLVAERSQRLPDLCNVKRLSVLDQKAALL